VERGGVAFLLWLRLPAEGAGSCVFLLEGAAGFLSGVLVVLCCMVGGFALCVGCCVFVLFSDVYMHRLSGDFFLGIWWIVVVSDVRYWFFFW